MTIKKRPSRNPHLKAKLSAGTLQFSNLDSTHPDPDYSDLLLTNGELGATLTDPENDIAEDLNFSQGESGPKRVTAAIGSRRPRVRNRARRMVAAEDSTNISTLDNDDDPADDYLPEDGVEGDSEDKSDLILQNAQGNGSNVYAAFGDEDTEDEDLDEDGEDEEDTESHLDERDDGEEDDGMDWDEEDDPIGQDLTADVDEDGDDSDYDDDKIEMSESDNPDAVPMLDIEEADDTVENLAFVMQANTLLAVKNTSVVATLSKLGAKRFGIDAHYATPAFATAMKAEVKRQGLRAALQSNGFVQKKVNLQASPVMARRLKLEHQRIKASLTASTNQATEAMEQAMAIASVGTSTGYFKAEGSQLKAALVSVLTAANVKSPEKTVSRLLAQHLPAHLETVYATATQLAAMPQDVRDHHIDSLDMIQEPAEAACHGLRSNTDDDEDGDEDYSEGVDLTASLIPARRINASADEAAAIAADILANKRPLIA